MQRLSGLSASTLRVGHHLGARAAPKIVASPPAPHNFRVKLSRPAFCPALKRLGRTLPARRHAGCSSVVRELRQPARRYSRLHSGPAAQLTAYVRPML